MTRSALPTFEQLFREHAPYVLRALRFLGVADAELEDVAQEVFVVVHRRLGDFEGRSSLKTWIYGILVRVASDHRKRAYVRRERPTEELPEPEPADAEDGETSNLLQHLLAQLDEPRRQIVVLYEIEGLTMPEVAALLEIPLQTAYTRLKAARERLEAAARAHEEAQR